MKKHFDIIISGKVHDVFFRDTTQKLARKLGIFGFVENHSDGTVYIEAEGNEDTLRELVTWCHKGPEQARVENVQVAEESLQNFADFTVR